MKAARKPSRRYSKVAALADGVPSLYISGIDELIRLPERKLQSRIVEPLLRALGFTNVRDTSGPAEWGKDLIATKHTQFGNTELYAIQLKKYRITSPWTTFRRRGACYPPRPLRPRRSDSQH